MIKKFFSWIKSKLQPKQIEDVVDEDEIGWPRDIAMSQLSSTQIKEWKNNPVIEKASRAISKILWGYEKYSPEKSGPNSFLEEVNNQIKNLKDITPELQKVLKELVSITKEYFPEKDAEKMAQEVISKLRR